MTVYWGDDLTSTSGVNVDLVCLAEAAMLADLVERLRANLRRMWHALCAGLMGTARAVGG